MIVKKIKEISIVNKLTNWYVSHGAMPYWGSLLIDCINIIISGMFAVYLVMGGDMFVGHFWNYILTYVCCMPLMAVAMKVFHTYSGIVRYSSFVDLMRCGSALILGFLLNNIWMAFVDDIHLMDITYRTQLVACGLAVLIMCALRIFVKYIYDFSFVTEEAIPVFIYGVKEGGISLAKSIRNENPSRYVVRGFVTDEENMTGKFLLGCNVYYWDRTLIRNMERKGVRTLFVSPMRSEAFRENQDLVDSLSQAGVKIMMMPEAQKWDGKSKMIHLQMREVDIEDLLPRDKIEVDMEAIGRLLENKVILITGAAGSIGSEMVKQIALFKPERLVLIDQAETPMHDVRLYMKKNYPYIDCEPIVTSITNAERMERIFRMHKPDYVFHAAAYKHVPMMEDNPSEAVQNNIYGTRVMADMAVKYRTKKFVMISTDKAVNPTNVMGCSKRICEIYCQSLNKAIVEGKVEGETQFVTTRFGNVLGSNGSVIPLFKKQIKCGGPITVTHKDIIRFFMLIPEACKLVLEAGTMGNGGEIFVFDMGKPVKIVDLAKRLIQNSGRRDVKIEYTGLRFGEKLYEEMLFKGEEEMPTDHPKIRVAKVRQYEYNSICEQFDKLMSLARTADDMEVVRMMKMIVPEFKSNNSRYEVLDRELERKKHA